MSNGETPSTTPRVVDVVVDASVAVKWFVPEDHSADALRLLAESFRRHVPVLLQTEVAQTLWKKVYQRSEIDAADARSVLRALHLTPLDVHAIKPLLEPAFEIALATGRTVYDSVYLALAVAVGCKLVTADRKLYNALQASTFAADVLWVADPI
jgi:predicted nucleic acid-binding protein